MPNKKRIILDTNFLLIPAQFGLDIFTELDKTLDYSYSLFIMDKSLEELKEASKQQKGALKEAVKVTLSLVKSMKDNNKLNIIPAKTSYIDREILETADKETLVATQDLELRKKLHEKGIKTIVMRQRKHLVIEG
ncbi:MAG TPA: hypothetical protein VJC00_04610 [Candidatus Nanoarchaeia archaeon]|nr:hypothetical protein [Candidatus Nanoarchaeia archaeon]